MRQKIILLMLLVLLAVSCATFHKDRPSWILEKPTSPGYVSFLSTVTAESEEEAKQGAYRDALNQLGSDLGSDLISQFFRELYTTDMVEDLGFHVSGTFEENVNGKYTCYVLSYIDDADLEKNRTEAYKAILEKEKQIENLLNQAFENYKSNQDAKALESTLQALDIAIDNTIIHEEYSKEVLLEKALGYLEKLNLKIVKKKTDSAHTTLSLRLFRGHGLRATSVENARLSFAYQCYNQDNQEQIRKISLNTDEKGSAIFTKKDFLMMRTGNVLVSLQLDENLVASLKAKDSSSFLSPLWTSLDSLSLTWSYADLGQRKSEDVLIALSEFNLDGSQRESTFTMDAVKNYFQKMNLSSYDFVVAPSGDEEKEVLESLAESYPEKSYFILVRQGIVDFRTVQKGQWSRAEAVLMTYDRKSNTYNSLFGTFSAAYGETAEQSEENAFLKDSFHISEQILSVL